MPKLEDDLKKKMVSYIQGDLRKIKINLWISIRIKKVY